MNLRSILVLKEVSSPPSGQDREQYFFPVLKIIAGLN